MTTPHDLLGHAHGPLCGTHLVRGDTRGQCARILRSWASMAANATTELGRFCVTVIARCPNLRMIFPVHMIGPGAPRLCHLVIEDGVEQRSCPRWLFTRSHRSPSFDLISNDRTGFGRFQPVIPGTAEVAEDDQSVVEDTTGIEKCNRAHKVVREPVDGF